MSLDQLVTGVIPVRAFAEERIPTQDAVTKPEVGLCWGKPAEFSYSAQDPIEDQDPIDPLSEFNSEDIDETVYNNGVEIYRELEKLEVKDPQGRSAIYRPETVKSVTFFLGDFLEESEEVTNIEGATIIQPFTDTIKSYLTFNFPTVAIVEDRGDKAPEATPEWDVTETKAPGTTGDEPEQDAGQQGQQGQQEPARISRTVLDLSPFRNVTDVVWRKLNERFWRVDYSYRNGKHNGGEFYSRIVREYDPNDPYTNYPIFFNRYWDDAFRKEAIANGVGLFAEGEAEKVTVTRSATAQRYSRWSGVPFPNASGNYEMLDWTFTAYRAPFPGWLIEAHFTFFTFGEADEILLPQKIEEWWQAILVNAPRKGQSELSKGPFYEIDAEGNKLP